MLRKLKLKNWNFEDEKNLADLPVIYFYEFTRQLFIVRPELLRPLSRDEFRALDEGEAKTNLTLAREFVTCYGTKVFAYPYAMLGGFELFQHEDTLTVIRGQPVLKTMAELTRRFCQHERAKWLKGYVLKSWHEGTPPERRRRMAATKGKQVENLSVLPGIGQRYFITHLDFSLSNEELGERFKKQIEELRNTFGVPDEIFALPEGDTHRGVWLKMRRSRGLPWKPRPTHQKNVGRGKYFDRLRELGAWRLRMQFKDAQAALEYTSRFLPAQESLYSTPQKFEQAVLKAKRELRDLFGLTDMPS